MIKLKKGDKVALIAPASGQKQHKDKLIQQAINCLSAWGLSVVVSPTLDANNGYLAANDTDRANSLITALTHPDIKAIFCTRGGYGCARLLPHITQANIDIPSPRLLLGFSDITTLHLHFTQSITKNLYCVHAPNLATEQFLSDSKLAANNRDVLAQLLFKQKNPDISQYISTDANLPANWHSQPKTGGCLSLLVTSLGTPHEINTKDKWLLIEEVGETPYKIDRMLTHLYNAGKFNDIRGVILGEMVQCDSQKITAQTVIHSLQKNLTCPVISLPYFGHGTTNLPWHYQSHND